MPRFQQTRKRRRQVSFTTARKRQRTGTVMAKRLGRTTLQELKFYDQSLVNSSLSAPSDSSGGERDPSATILLNTVVQGDGEEQRDGRQIVMKKISIKGVVTVPVQTAQIAADEASTVFIAIVLDTQTNGATINSEDVFKNKGANPALAASPFRNLRNVQRFQVLKTVTLALIQPQMAAKDSTNIETGGYKMPFEMHKRLNIQVNYSGTAETVVSINDNSLHVIAFTSSTGVNPSISYNSRLRFVG